MNEEELKTIINKANVQRAFVATVARAFACMIDDMVKYCKDNDLQIPMTERRQLSNIKKSITIFTSDYVLLNKDKSDSFKTYSKIMAVVIQQLFSKTDSSYMTMFKFYNYVKTFPTTCKSIEVTSEQERDVFSVIFGSDNNSDS